MTKKTTSSVSERKVLVQSKTKPRLSKQKKTQSQKVKSQKSATKKTLVSPKKRPQQRKAATLRKTGSQLTAKINLFRKNSRKNKKQNPTKKRELVLEIGLSLLLLSIIVGIVSFFSFRIVKVEGYAMSPRINDQEWVIVSKLSEVDRFDFAYFTDPVNGRRMIRRVIGLPGEKVAYKDGLLYINDKEVPERFFRSVTQSGTDLPFTEDFELTEILGNRQYQIPDDYYFVLGDNRPYATDSRFFGLVSKEKIMGKVTMRLLPLRSMRRFL